MARCNGTRSSWPGWMCLVMLVACAAPATPTHQARQQDAALADRVTEWALGERLRMVRRKSRAAARLMLLPQQGAPQPLLGDCVDARSLLPSSTKPGELFLIVAGKLHVVDTSSPRATLVPIATEPADVVLSQLLAMSKQAPPVEILALAQQITKDGQASTPGLWRFLIEDHRARGALVPDAPQPSDAETFFRHFSAPRCRESGSDCLVIANGDEQSFLDVVPAPGGDRREWRALGTTWIEDARWNPADQSSALLLVRCQPQAR